MKISEQWLREWVSPELSSEELAHQITMAGLEVDAIEPVAGAFSGVVVARIISAEQHPDADKLRVCQVDAGGETVQIVCGAPNARAGLVAPLARVGAVLPGDFKIKAAKLRGVESQGMLCAEQELGLSDANDGLMELAADAPAGTDLREYLGLDDKVIEIGLTPNRADCLGIAGIAREVGLLNGLPVRAPEFEHVSASIEDTFPVELQAPERCPRYLGSHYQGRGYFPPQPPVAAGKTAPLRYSQYRRGGGCHQLRVAGAGPAHARFRSRQTQRRYRGARGALPVSPWNCWTASRWS